MSASAVTRLPVADELTPTLTAVLSARHWQPRQQAAGQALEVLHRAQHATGLPTPRDGATQPFFDRPFLGVRAETVDALMNSITDPLVRRLPPGVGTAEQWINNVNVLTNPLRRVQAARAHLDTATPASVCLGMTPAHSSEGVRTFQPGGSWRRPAPN